MNSDETSTSEEEIIRESSSSESLQFRDSSDETVSTRKRKRILSDDEDLSEVQSPSNATNPDRRLTSRQLALQGKEKKMSSEGSSNDSSKKKSLTEQDALKKTLQAEKRKRQKEEAMVEQKEAILRKYASAMNAKREKQTTDSSDTQKVEKVRPISDISYISSMSGSFISFGPNVQLPSCFETRESVERRELLNMKCCVPECHNSRKYFDSTTKLPLCSLNCYKKLHASLVAK